MMALSKALYEVRATIPAEILLEVFAAKDIWFRRSSATIDENITATVVRPRVMVDANLVGGLELLVDLAGVVGEKPNNFTTVFRVPKDRTQGRSIISALYVMYGDLSRMSPGNVSASMGQSAMLQTAQSMVDAMGALPVTGTANVQLIGENTIMVREQSYLPSTLSLRCIIENDDQLSHLQLRSLGMFAKLVVLAVKAYIYNYLIIRMDQGQLAGGHNLGVFKTIVESYADANELYDTFLREKWQKIALMNDRESYTRLIKTVIGGPR